MYYLYVFLNVGIFECYFVILGLCSSIRRYGFFYIWINLIFMLFDGIGFLEIICYGV